MVLLIVVSYEIKNFKTALDKKSQFLLEFRAQKLVWAKKLNCGISIHDCGCHTQNLRSL